MTLFATADQIARAVVAASVFVGADPTATVMHKSLSGSRAAPETRARLLAFAGLLAALPGARVSAIARGLNFPYKGSVAVQKIQTRPAWWREDWVDEIVSAVLAPDLDEAFEELAPPVVIPPPNAALAALAVATAPPLRIGDALPPPRKPSRGGAPLALGEPEPGRSALDRRGLTLPGGAGEEDDERRGKRKSVSLPRLKFLENNRGLDDV